MSRLVAGLVLVAVVSGSGCVTPPKHSDYTKFRSDNPHSILVVPATNKSVEVNAPDYLLATISIPLAERGFYVFPVNLVRGVLADDGLSDANLVHAGDPHRLGELFGADAVMYISIERWDAKYIVLATTVTVDLMYSLKSTRTGEEIWSNHQAIVYQPQGNSGGGLAGLLVDAVAAAITKAAPNYVPLAKQANANALLLKGTGLPSGPHDPLYEKDGAEF